MAYKKSNKIELLAPANNIQIAKSAIIYGADAIYIGANSFSARKSASNSIEDIKELVEFAHKYNAKVYVTLNTILTDDELIQAKKMIDKLYEIKVDALIIQDMGLLELELPPIELHASTQCNIRTLNKAKFLEDVGFKRIILARELSIEKIKEIRENTSVEIETFIHGALCVSYSGNCYMSSYIGGRSANRGECAQACRMPYSLVDSKGKILSKDKYLLSMKDLCLQNYLNELINIGVKSFKIEGRLKDENYVKNVVLYYRKLLDKYNKTSDGIIISDFTPDINKTFNRGYTSYFIKEENEISNINTPKSIGEYIGNIKEVSKNHLVLNTDKKLSPQDGLCFISNGNLNGFLINKVTDNIIYPNRMPKNINKEDKIYRNKDTVFEQTLKNSKTKRIILIEAEIYKDKIKFKDDKNEAIIGFEFMEYAKNEDKMKETFINSLKKSGEYIFSCTKVIFLGKVPYLPLSQINDIRNRGYKLLEDKRIENYKPSIFNKINHPKYNETDTDYRLNIHNKKAFEFYKKCGVCNLEYSLETTKDYKNKELMRTKYCIRKALNICLKNKKEANKLFLVDSMNKKYSITFDCKNCENIIGPL